MPLVATDWEVNVDKSIRYIGAAHGALNAGYVTVLELHRWLQDLADADTISGDDFLAITVANPTDKKFDTIIQLLNGFTLYDTGGTPAAEYIYAGTIIQGSGTTEVIWDGISVIANRGVKVNVIQNNALLTNSFWNNVPNTAAARVSSGTTVSGVNTSGQKVLNVANGSLFTAGQTIMINGFNQDEYVIDSIVSNALTLTANLVSSTAGGETVFFSTRGINPDITNGLAMQFMVKVKNFGVFIDGTATTNGGALLFTTREWGRTYSEFRVPATGRGKNSVPLSYASDLNNASTIATVAALSGISNLNSGYNAIDVNNDTTNEFYYSKWDRGANSINSFYERMKWLTRSGYATTMDGIPGEQFRGITHEFVVDTPTGTFSAQEDVVWGTLITAGFVIAGTAGQFTCTNPTPFTLSVGQPVRISGTLGGTGSITGYADPTTYLISATNGTTSFTLVTLAGAAIVTTAGTPTGLAVELQTGSGRMLAIDSTTAATRVWVQMTKGSIPLDNMRIRGATSAATCLLNVTVTERTLSAPVCGASTGSSLVGAYGFSLEYADLAVNDKIQALDAITRQPPNNVTFTVSGVASGWRVLVGPEASGSLDYNQLTTTAVLTGAAVTSVTFVEAAPANTPPTGNLRILRADGSYSRHPYSAYNAGTKTFTITSHNFSTNNSNATKKFFISYIDAAASGASISFTTVQTATQTLYVSARYAGTGPAYTDSIKPASTTGTLGATGGSATISSVSDA